MFTGYKLTEASRAKLLGIFPPRYESVLAHHVTETFGVSADTPPPTQPESFRVVGHFDSGDGVEGLLVEVDGTTKRPDGRLYHVTWSLGQGRRPVESNNHAAKAKPVEPVSFDAVAMNFSK